jgi:hypothetical protein
MNLIQKRLSKQLARDTIVPKGNCKELGPISACGKQVKNRKLITQRPTWPCHARQHVHVHMGQAQLVGGTACKRGSIALCFAWLDQQAYRKRFPFSFLFYLFLLPSY